MNWSVNARAARALAARAHDAADLAHLLDVLGLVGDDGRLAPDDTRVYSLRDPGTGQDPMLDNLTRRDPAAQAPAGLAVLQPVSEQPKPKKPSKYRKQRTVAEGRPSRAGKPRKVAQCGTTSGHARHIRLGEPTCEPCRAAKRAWAAERRKGQPSKVPPRPPCGTRNGYDAHLHRGEPTCQPCRDANAERQRERYAEKATEMGRHVRSRGPLRRAS